MLSTQFINGRIAKSERHIKVLKAALALSKKGKGVQEIADSLKQHSSSVSRWFRPVEKRAAKKTVAAEVAKVANTAKKAVKKVVNKIK